MKQNEPADRLERLFEPVSSPEDRARLEDNLSRNARTCESMKAYRILQEWPVLERPDLYAAHPTACLERLEQEWSVEAVDREIGRVFPFVAAAALVAAIILGTVNVLSTSDAVDDPLDAILGLPKHSLDEMILAEL